MKPHHAVLVALVLAALVIRLGFFISSPNPYENSGLVAEHGEVARNIVSNGAWFVVNRKALAMVTELQNRRHRLVDPDKVSYAGVEAHPDRAPEVLQTPGLALVLATFWEVTGDRDYAYAQVLQILLDSTMVVLVYSI